MKPWSVCFVTAFGRGETLAIALQDNGFDVQVLDFTKAFTGGFDHGAGPFPIATARFQPKQSLLLEDVRPLERGLALWLAEGPVELSGPLSIFFGDSKPFITQLRTDKAAPDFETDWLRRFLTMWTSPYHLESWQKPVGGSFPYAMEMGLLPSNQESRRLSFERFQTLEYKYQAANALLDVGFDGGKLEEILVDAGRKTAVRADQWVWCLASSETESLNAQVAGRVFMKGIRRPQWRWLSYHGRCDRGTWTAGFPEYSVLLGDIHLPWVYSNMMCLRWLEADAFQVWMKVPAEASHLPDRRADWARDAEKMLQSRLPLANWKVDAEQWSLCPHSLVFDEHVADLGVSNWRNWDWIAPETMNRLDLSARLEKEAQSLSRLQQWRTDQLKKKGAAGDHALHAP